MNTPIKCADCRHSYQGADLTLRCRPRLSDENECAKLAERCMDFEREAGADGVESPWFSGAWCADKA